MSMDNISFLYGKLEVLALTICRRDNKAFHDMVGDGMEIILRMEPRFNAGRGVALWDYVKHHVEKAMWKEFNSQNRSAVASFDDPVGDEDSDRITLADTLADPISTQEYELSQEQREWEEAMVSRIGKARGHCLNQQEKSVIRLYCLEKSTRSIATRLCMSTARVRQIRRNALNKLRMEVTL